MLCENRQLSACDFWWRLCAFDRAGSVLLPNTLRTTRCACSLLRSPYAQAVAVGISQFDLPRPRSFFNLDAKLGGYSFDFS